MENVTQSKSWVCQYCGRDDFDNMNQRNGHFAQCDAYWFEHLSLVGKFRASPLKALGVLRTDVRFIRYLDEQAELLSFAAGLMAGLAAATNPDLRRELVTAIAGTVALAIAPTLVSKVPVGRSLSLGRRKRLRDHPAQFAAGAALGYALALVGQFQHTDLL